MSHIQKENGVILGQARLQESQHVLQFFVILFSR